MISITTEQQTFLSFLGWAMAAQGRPYSWDVDWGPPGKRPYTDDEEVEAYLRCFKNDRAAIVAPRIMRIYSVVETRHVPRLLV